MIAALTNQGVLDNPVAQVVAAFGLIILAWRLFAWALAIEVEEQEPPDHHYPDPPSTVRVIRPPYDWSAE